MGPKENGGERKDSINNIIKDKEGKDVECEYEQARHSVSSSQGGETPMIDDNKVKKILRVPQKNSRKQAVENFSRPTKCTSGRKESTKSQLKLPNNNRKKSEKPKKGAATTKNLSNQKADNRKVSTKSSSDMFEVADEKVIVCKHVENIKEMEVLDETLNCSPSGGTDEMPNCDRSVGTDETPNCSPSGGTKEMLNCDRIFGTDEILNCNQSIGTYESPNCNQNIRTYESPNCNQSIERYETLNCNQSVGTYETSICDQSVGADETFNCDQSVGTDETPICDQSVGTDETIDEEDNSVNEIKKVHDQKIVEMALRIDKLEEELREVAALEISLYSVAPEHEISVHKVNTPARRLSRLYIYACKHGTQDKRATVARNTVSGLVSIVKSCGSDVSRLTFWLSNIIVLREIITGASGNNISHSSIMNKVGESNDIAYKNDAKSISMKWNTNYGSKNSKKYGFFQFSHDWQETDTYTDGLEKIESWIFSRIVDSVWWKTLTPHMQSPVDLYERKYHGKLMEPVLGDPNQGVFSIELWKNTFFEAFSLLCPMRAEGRECGCLPVLARMVMEQCISRLDVAMFNAILRESAYEFPTDPVSDPIVDSKVLPISAGDLSFGSGALLKKSIGIWSRWLTDLLGMDIEDIIEYGQADQDDVGRWGGDNETKWFCLLHSLSELLMLPKDMLLDRSIRKEVCPLIDPPLLTRILCNFTPDEFCEDLVPDVVLEELNSEHSLFEKASSTSFPFSASSIIYCPPSVAEVAQKVADIGGKALIGGNAEIIQSKGYSSDEELDDLDSPFTLILNDTHKISIENARFKLLREAWSP